MLPKAKSGINRLKRNRAVATRFDKLAVRYEANVHIAAIKRVAPQPIDPVVPRVDRFT